MKVRKSSTQEEIKKRKKAVLFCLSDDKRQIIVEEAKQILVGDIGDTVEDPYTSFVKLLPLNDCRYALYDATYETKESKKEDLVFIFWAPESAPLKSKMIYASSKDAIKKKFTGIKHEWQVNGLDDIKDRSTLGEKLGGNPVAIEDSGSGWTTPPLSPHHPTLPVLMGQPIQPLSIAPFPGVPAVQQPGSPVSHLSPVLCCWSKRCHTPSAFPSILLSHTLSPGTPKVPYLKSENPTLPHQS
ncbi:hypothetical protein P7K49_013675 [Saguinus oedipus]|uniref:ADF-H domain-containing protein n=1 Tax=Saguinus oedipus TaxID=9490 RepID=A0ABQ9VHE1_SAGOE|nr:hypothetical protein P7K49_013675 [Saguinus oedipus]